MALELLIEAGRIAEAADLFADGLLRSKGEGQGPTLTRLVEAGGLGHVALALEHLHGGVSASDLALARGQLKRLKDGFQRTYRPPEEVLYAAKLDRVTRLHFTRGVQVSAKDVDLLYPLAAIELYSESELPGAASFPEGAMPGFLTDFLLRRPGQNPGEGSCFARHLLAFEMGQMIGRRFSFLQPLLHLNLFDHATGLVADIGSTLELSRIEEWQVTGLLGGNQSPAGAELVITAQLLMFGELAQFCEDFGRAVYLYEAGLALFPDDPSLLVKRALWMDDPHDALAMLDRAVQLSPRHPWAHGLRSIFLDEVGRKEEGLTASRSALQHAIEILEATKRVFGESFHIGPTETDIAQLRFHLEETLRQRGIS